MKDMNATDSIVQKFINKTGVFIMAYGFIATEHSLTMSHCGAEWQQTHSLVAQFSRRWKRAFSSGLFVVNMGNREGRYRPKCTNAVFLGTFSTCLNF